MKIKAPVSDAGISQTGNTSNKPKVIIDYYINRIELLVLIENLMNLQG